LAQFFDLRPSNSLLGRTWVFKRVAIDHRTNAYVVSKNAQKNVGIFIQTLGIWSSFRRIYVSVQKWSGKHPCNRKKYLVCHRTHNPKVWGQSKIDPAVGQARRFDDTDVDTP
jgi:hypothetical protein